MSITKIPWATHSINPIRVKSGGWHCTKVSPGCQNCYAETMNMRFGNKKPYDDSPVEYELDLSCFDKLPKRKPAIVFVQSMSDLFHEDVPFHYIDSIWEQTTHYRQHKFLFLTKRPERMKEYFETLVVGMDNYWLGVSCENQEMADKRIPILLQIPAAVRFVSFEPLLGGIINKDDECKFSDILDSCKYCGMFSDICNSGMNGGCRNFKSSIEWVIIGAESGQNQRYCDPNWMIDIVKQCDNADVPVFVKQIHFGHGSKIKGDFKHWISKNMSEWPAELQRQEYPS